MTDFQFQLVDDGEPAIYETPTLYKLDSAGRLRTWKMQLTSEGHYRTLSGLADGKQAESKWTIPVPASKATVKDQGEFEVRSQVKHQLDREYHDNPDTVSQPKIIEPMLAKTYGAWPGPGFSQPKLDGIRCIMTVAGMFTRQGQPIVAVPHLHAACEQLFKDYPDLVLDGELYNHDLREDFGEISSIVRKKNPSADDLAKAERVMQYHVYDTVDPDSRFSDRSSFLRVEVQDVAPGWVVLVPTGECRTEAEADEDYAKFVEAGYEGGMYRLDSFYEIGRRSKNLLKRKEFLTEEFPVVNIEAGTGNWAGAAKRFTLSLADGRTFGAGVRGSYADLKKLLASGQQGGEATVRFFQLSPDGVPRFPVVIDYHPNGRVD